MSDTRTKPGYIAVGLGLMLFAIVCNSFGNKLLLLDAPMVLPIGGIGLLLLAVGFPACYLPKGLAQVSAISFGIYLCHVVFLEAFEFMAPRLYAGPITYNFLVKVTEVTLIFALSASFALLLRRMPLLRRVFLGEGTEAKTVDSGRIAVKA